MKTWYNAFECNVVRRTVCGAWCIVAITDKVASIASKVKCDTLKRCDGSSQAQPDVYSNMIHLGKGCSLVEQHFINLAAYNQYCIITNAQSVIVNHLLLVSTGFK